MRKIPTLFVRDPDDRKHVLQEVTPGCEWVLAGEGVPTRKYDGTCIMFDGWGAWWARREVKPGKNPPENFVAVEHDPTTGKIVGWEPADQSSFWKYLQEVVEGKTHGRAGTYELIGPKINGNPEHVDQHHLVRHGSVLLSDLPDFGPEDAYVKLSAYLLFAREDIEGIVWHHPDGRMAKLKRRDFT